MSSTATSAPGTVTLPFDKFWAWLQVHANCILRAGTPDLIVFDHEDYHWHLANEDATTLILQLVRGKELVAEMVILASEIAYVQCSPGEESDAVFECVVETPAGRDVAYHFVLAHEYDESEEPPDQAGRRWTH